MSKYTTELRFICETYADLDQSKGYSDVEDIIESSRSKIFDFPYEIFDEEYRPVLEHKILRHFYTREIGQETVGLFKLQLSQKMNDIMPYYNQLYKSALLEIDPLTDVNYERSGSESMSTSESTLSSLSTSEMYSESEFHSNSMWDMYQETPQNQLNGVANLEYLTNATLDKDHGNSEGRHNNDILSTGRGITDRTDLKRYLEKFKGYRNNNPSKLLNDYRETFLNIDLMIIGELEKLFFQLW
jgi:hypothetical protein